MTSLLRWLIQFCYNLPMSKSTFPRLIPPLLTAAALGAVGYAALQAARMVWERNVNYRSPYTTPLPIGTPLHRPLARRAILVVLDGLRCDTAMTMPTLVKLRESGVGVVSRVGLPSLSLPGWTAMLTGAGQEISGVNSNFYSGTPTISSILSLAQRQGRSTAIVGDRAWQQLFGPHVNFGKYVQWQKALGEGRTIAADYIVGPRGYQDKEGILGSDRALLAAALDIWPQQRPDFMVLHLSAADNFGHGYGGASYEYRTIARDHLDRALSELLAVVDLADTAIFVTSDHGHLDRGGHGGAEEIVLDSPLIMAGAGIKPDAQGMGYAGREQQVDIAPTLAVLLGLPLPTHNQGRPLTEFLQLDERDKAAADLAWLQQQSDFYQLYAERSGASEPLITGVSRDRLRDDLQQGEYDEVSKATHQAIRTLHAEAREWREQRLELDRRPRTAQVFAAALPLTLLTLWQTAAAARDLQDEQDDASLHQRLAALMQRTAVTSLQHSTFKIVTAGLLTNIVYRNLYAGRGHLLSLSTFRTDDKLQQFFLERIADSAAAGLAAAAMLGLTMRRHAPASVAAAVAAATCWGMLTVGAQIGWFYRQWGTEYEWHLPDYRYAFKFYLDIVQFGGYALAALPGIGVALALRWLANLPEDKEQP